jgi:hypothetical protein
MTDKKFYVMKRLATENEESQALYEGLLNEGTSSSKQPLCSRC